MKNILESEQKINVQYDLKGSTIGRLVEFKEGVERNPDMSLKDLNFDRKLVMGKSTRKTFLHQVEKDSKFLEERNICDYSLLIGFSFLDPIKDFPPNNSQGNFSQWTQEYGGLLARSATEEPYKEVYYVGIIDVLTEYDIKKKSEHAIKSILYRASEGEISAVPPAAYKERFLKYISSIIIGEDE